MSRYRGTVIIRSKNKDDDADLIERLDDLQDYVDIVTAVDWFKQEEYICIDMHSFACEWSIASVDSILNYLNSNNYEYKIYIDTDVHPEMTPTEYLDNCLKYYEHGFGLYTNPKIRNCIINNNEYIKIMGRNP